MENDIGMKSDMGMERNMNMKNGISLEEVIMDDKWAQKRAANYINGLQDYKQIMEWSEGSKPKKIMNAFEKSCLSEKPRRVLKRLAPLLHPEFQWPKIFSWTRKYKGISAVGMASSVENRIFCLPNEIMPLYSERAVVMTNFMLLQNEGDCKNILMTRASISDHAIGQLMKPKGVSGMDSSEEIAFILQYCAAIAQRIHDSTFDSGAMTSIMLPYRQGALVAAFMTGTPTQIHPDADVKGFRMLSIRNWIDKDKLSTMDMERMGDVDEVRNIMERGNNAADERLLRWLAHNVRPWQYSDHTIDHVQENNGEIRS